MPTDNYESDSKYSKEKKKKEKKHKEKLKSAENSRLSIDCAIIGDYIKSGESRI